MAANREFGLFVDPSGCVLVEYAHERDGIRVRSSSSIARQLSTEVDAVHACVQALNASKVRGASVVVVVDGLGTVGHTMSLPPASDEVIRPIVQREVSRVYGLQDPSVAFVRGVQVERRHAAREGAAATVPPQPIVIVAVPGSLLNRMRTAFEEIGVRLALLTGVPHAVRRLYQAADGSHELTAVLACAGGRPHLSLFLDGELSVALDPPVGPPAERGALAGLAVEELRQGVMYLRQHFGGATIARVVVLAASDAFTDVAAAVRDALSLPVAALAPTTGSAEGGLVIGAALEMDADMPLSVVPRRPSAWRRMVKAVRIGSRPVGVLAAAALLFAIIAVAQLLPLRRDMSEAVQLKQRFQASIAAAAPLTAVAAKRLAANRAASVALDAAADRRAVAGLLAGVASELPSGILLDSLSVSSGGDGWHAVIAGRARARSTAGAVQLVDAFYRGIPRRLPVRTPSLDGMEVVPGTADSAVVVSFRVSLVTPSQFASER